MLQRPIDAVDRQIDRLIIPGIADSGGDRGAELHDLGVLRKQTRSCFARFFEIDKFSRALR